MTIDLDTLEAAAKEATPGPWEDDMLYNVRESNDSKCVVVVTKTRTERFPTPNDAAFIAAANPATVLELIAELRAEREKYTNAVKAYKAVVQEGQWLAFQVHKRRKRCPPLQECNKGDDDIVTENDCQQCWLNAAREAVEEKK